MLGAVLLSAHNELIHALGNAHFRAHFLLQHHQQQQKQQQQTTVNNTCSTKTTNTNISPPTEVNAHRQRAPSSSSGISSPANCFSSSSSSSSSSNSSRHSHSSRAMPIFEEKISRSTILAEETARVLKLKDEEEVMTICDTENENEAKEGENNDETAIFFYQQQEQQPQQHFQQEEEEHYQMFSGYFDTDEDRLLCQLLPLVAISRSSGVGGNNNNKRRHSQQLLESIHASFSLTTVSPPPTPNAAEATTSSNRMEATELQIRIGHLPFGCLLILLCSQSLSADHSEQLFRSLLRCLNFHYGPEQFQLLPMDTPFVRQLRRRCEHRMRILLGRFARREAEKMERKEEEEKVEEEEGEENCCCFDRNFAVSPNGENIVRSVQRELGPALREFIKSISRQIGGSNGDNVSCIFLCANRLLACCGSADCWEEVKEKENGTDFFSSSSSFPPNFSSPNYIPDGEFRSILEFSRQPFQAEEDNEEEEEEENEEEEEEFEEFEKQQNREEEGGERRRRSRNLLKCQSESVFLQPQMGKCRLLHNIFVVSFNEHSELVFLALSELSSILAHVTECLEIIGSVENNFSVNLFSSSTLISKCLQRLKGIQWDLKRTEGKVPRGYYYYLSDSKSTIALIQRLWDRFRASLDQFSSLMATSQNERSTNIYLSSPSPSSSHSLNSSSSSSYSSSSSSSTSTINAKRNFHATNTPSNSLNSTRIDEEEEDFQRSKKKNRQQESSLLLSSNASNLLIANLIAIKRLLLTLLNELLSWNAERASTKLLPFLRHELRQPVHKRLAQSIAFLDAQMAGKTATGMRPARLGLDILAYRFEQTSGGPPFFFHFAQEAHSQLFNQLMDVFSTTFQRENALGGEEGKNNKEWEKEEKEEEEEETMTVLRTVDRLLVLELHSTPNSNNSSTVKPTAQKLRQQLAQSTFRFLFGASPKQFLGSKQRKQQQQKQQKQFSFLALFPAQMNVMLAAKQAQTLMNALQKTLE